MTLSSIFWASAEAASEAKFLGGIGASFFNPFSSLFRPYSVPQARMPCIGRASVFFPSRMSFGFRVEGLLGGL